MKDGGSLLGVYISLPTSFYNRILTIVLLRGVERLRNFKDRVISVGSHTKRCMNPCHTSLCSDYLMQLLHCRN